MDINKAKRFLDKINREFARMASRPEDIAQIDKDILLDYTRDFYDAILSEAISQRSSTRTNTSLSKPAVAEVTPVIQPKAAGPKQISITEPVAEVKQSAPAPVVKPTPKAEEVVVKVVPKPAPAPPKPAPVVEAPKPVPPVEVVKPQVAPVQSRPSIQADAETLALFEFGQAKELSDRLVQPVSDIWSAIGLNDRLLFTKELFKGDNAAMKNSVEALNILGNYEEAKAFLVQTVAMRNDWASDGRAEFARSFIKTVRRRFL